MAETANISKRQLPVKRRDGITILDIEKYPPFLLNALSGAWIRKTSAIYRRRFGLGIAEWRIIAMLNIEPRITANRICAVLRFDKASASRVLKLLDREGIVTYEASPTDDRKRRWWLSEKGLKIHDDLLAIALRCEEEMVADVAPEDLETLLGVMQKMLNNLEG